MSRWCILPVVSDRRKLPSDFGGIQTYSGCSTGSLFPLTVRTENGLNGVDSKWPRSFGNVIINGYQCVLHRSLSKLKGPLYLPTSGFFSGRALLILIMLLLSISSQCPIRRKFLS